MQEIRRIGDPEFTPTRTVRPVDSTVQAVECLREQTGYPVAGQRHTTQIFAFFPIACPLHDAGGSNAGLNRPDDVVPLADLRNPRIDRPLVEELEIRFQPVQRGDERFRFHLKIHAVFAGGYIHGRFPVAVGGRDRKQQQCPPLISRLTAVEYGVYRVGETDVLRRDDRIAFATVENILFSVKIVIHGGDSFFLN